MSIGIYYIKNTINGKLYIGKSKNIENRIRDHIKELYRNKHANKHLQTSFNKYGIDNFQFETIEIFDTLDKAYLNEREKYWISFYKTIDSKYGYNKTKGGDGGELIGESLESMRNKLKGRKCKEDVKLFLSITMKGQNSGENNGMFQKIPWNKGKSKDKNDSLLQASLTFNSNYKKENHPFYNIKRPECHCINISKGLSGISKSLEHKHKLSLVNLGKKDSDETRRKKSASKKGVPQKKVECPYCHKIGGTTMYRWHFNNCKFKKEVMYE
jgi:group I intron endonuclease